MDREGMMSLFSAHREAEARRDFDAVMDTFTTDCYLETVALGLRSEGREAARSSYVAYFTAFPDLAPEDNGFAAGDDVLVSWGVLRGTSGGDWLGIPPSGGSFAVQFTNVSTFRNEHMRGETIYFDLATLCEQAGLPIDSIRAAARARRSGLSHPPRPEASIAAPTDRSIRTDEGGQPGSESGREPRLSKLRDHPAPSG